MREQGAEGLQNCLSSVNFISDYAVLNPHVIRLVLLLYCSQAAVSMSNWLGTPSSGLGALYTLFQITTSVELLYHPHFVYRG